MKKIIIISSGIVLILLLAGIWLYLLFYGPPDTVEDVFSDFSFGGDAPVVESTPEADNGVQITDESTSDTSTAEQHPLRQITTAAVAGQQLLSTEQARDLAAATSSNSARNTTVRYVEAGTGHVYDYDVHSSERTRVSGATIPEARHAYISTDGSFVVIESNNGLQRISFDENNEGSAPEELSLAADNIHLTDNNILVYTNSTAERTTGYAYNLNTDTEQTLFTTPMRYIAVSWGSQHDSQHIIYPRPADSLIGYAYRVTPNQSEHTRLPISGYGLTLLHENNQVFYSTVADINNPQERISYVYDIQESNTSRLPTTVLPEKCAFYALDETLWCANDFSQTTALDAWYKGTGEFTDSLWSLNLIRNSSRHEINPLRTSGRAIDVYTLQSTRNQPELLLVNKIDRALWFYDPTL